jgi:hypothetical protein
MQPLSPPFLRFSLAALLGLLLCGTAYSQASADLSKEAYPVCPKLPPKQTVAVEQAPVVMVRGILKCHEKDVPLGGIKVEIVGTTAYAFTDAKGHFAMNLPSSDAENASIQIYSTTPLGFRTFSFQGEEVSKGNLVLEFGVYLPNLEDSRDSGGRL